MRVHAFLPRGVLPLVLLAVAAAPSFAQTPLRLEPIVSGLTEPVGFVQDPSDPTVQHIVEKGGLIRVLKNGVLEPAAFLDLSRSVVTAGEQGLLGLAFPSDYAISGRFYVCFTSPPDGRIVVARFTRSSNPLLAVPESRKDLVWSTGLSYIEHPGFSNHNGGHLAFGPDGYLYISVGDGGGSGDPGNNAQTRSTLLGKMLRIDVNVPASHANGFVVPTTNPFVGVAGTRPEIWSFGLRNPWQFSFDAGTGGLWIGDVGQGAWEEVNYEPPAQGGRNYGWSILEGTHPFNQTRAPAFTPLVDPVFEYSHSVGRSITGGVAYYGRALGAAYIGRYFFADFVTRRVWSVLRTSDTTVAGLREHSDEIGGGPVFGNISSFGVDANGEIYLVSYDRGQVFRLAASSLPIVHLDWVRVQGELIDVYGWAIDRAAATSSGIDTVHVYAFPNPGSGTPPIFVGFRNAPFDASADVAAAFGPQFGRARFRIQRFEALWLPNVPTLFVAYARSTITGRFSATATFFLNEVVTSGLRVDFDFLLSGQALRQPIPLIGWALDPVVATAPASFGTGISTIEIDVFKPSSSGRQFVQTLRAAYGLPRPDVAAIFGPRFHDSGFYVEFRDLGPGEYEYDGRAWMTAANHWRRFVTGSFTVLPGPMLAIGTPAENQTVSSSFLVSGWTLDLRAPSGTGVDAVHVWAYKDPGSGTPPVFLGVAAYGASRPDVGSIFGSRFTPSGFNLIARGLAPGNYAVVVYAHTTVTGTFDIYRIVRVTVQ